MHDPSYKEMYSSVKKQYDELLIKARSEQYTLRLKNSENKNKCMWSIYNEMTKNTKYGTDCMIAGNLDETSNNFNTFLIDSIPELLKKISSNVNSKINIQENQRSLIIRPVTEQEIINITQKIKNKHSSGDDEIPTSLIRQIIPAITKVLCYILNNSLTQGVFPEA